MVKLYEIKDTGEPLTELSKLLIFLPLQMKRSLDFSPS